MESSSSTKEKIRREAVCEVQIGEERNQFVENNIGLVHMVLKRFVGRGYDMEDLFQIGSVGLIKAIDRFDPSLGFSFSTYAVPVIIGEIRRFLRDDGLVHISRKIKDDMRHIAKESEEIRNETGREPTMNELEIRTGLNREEIFLALESGYEVESLSKPVRFSEQGDGQDVLLQDKIADDKCTYTKMIDTIMLKQVLEKIDPEERQIIHCRYLLGKTQTETAKLLQMNQVAVSRKEKKILEKLRLYLKEG